MIKAMHRQNQNETYVYISRSHQAVLPKNAKLIHFFFNPLIWKSWIEANWYCAEMGQGHSNIGFQRASNITMTGKVLAHLTRKRLSHVNQSQLLKGKCNA